MKITIKCKNCGAPNTFSTRSIPCEYCNTILYSPSPRKIIAINAMDCGVDAKQAFIWLKSFQDITLPKMPKCTELIE